MTIYKLFNEDCLVKMAQWDKPIFDLILCDLPYGITQNSWDCELDIHELWRLYKKVIKVNGCIALCCSQPFTSKLICSNLQQFKYTWTWVKNSATGFLNAKKQPLRNSEDIAIFYARQPTYNPVMMKGKPYKCNAGAKSSNYGKQVDVTTYNDGTNYYPKSVIEFDVAHNKNKLHPTQKPVALMEYLIKTYTNENDLVLDNCMGSGTIGVACMNTNRKFVGIELDKNYFDIAKDRIEKAYQESVTRKKE